MSQKKPPKKTSTKRPDPAGGPMSVGLLEQLVKLMSTNDLNTVDVRDGDQRIILKRGAPVATGTPVTYAPPAHAGVASSAAVSHASVPVAASDENAGLVAIKSPMVGTFYAKPSPDAKAFVELGATVNEETDVCVIEAMKVFNNIKAEISGTVAKIVAVDGKPVEFGQTLFLIKPA